MNLEEIITVAVKEFLDIEVHPDTNDLDFMAKIEIVKKRMKDKVREEPELYESLKLSKNYKYEMLFKSNPNDMVKINGWIPIDSNILQETKRIDEFIEIGLLRKIKK